MGEMNESGTTGQQTLNKVNRRTSRHVLAALLILFLFWLLLANHVIVVTEEPAFVILRKTSWTFNSCFIGESSWASFAFHHPVLTTRLAMGDGFWILGNPP